MTTIKKQPAAPTAPTGKRPSKPAPARKAAAAHGHAPKPGIVLGLYKDRLRIAPDFFEPHETPPGAKKQAA